VRADLAQVLQRLEDVSCTALSAGAGRPKHGSEGHWKEPLARHMRVRQPVTKTLKIERFDAFPGMSPCRLNDRRGMSRLVHCCIARHTHTHNIPVPLPLAGPCLVIVLRKSLESAPGHRPANPSKHVSGTLRTKLELWLRAGALPASKRPTLPRTQNHPDQCS
jgi:hypothetical protein